MKKILNPNFITGFTDAEGCFHVSIVSSLELKTGKSVRVLFQISLNKKDKPLLELIKYFFGVGKIIDRKDGVFYYQVSSVKDLKQVLEHFDKYPLLSQKRADYELFKQVINLILSKQHLTTNGLQEIVNVKYSMNFGLSDSLQESYPNIVPVNRPIIEYQEIPDPD
jgi:hypothetical protein